MSKPFPHLITRPCCFFSCEDAALGLKIVAQINCSTIWEAQYHTGRKEVMVWDASRRSDEDSSAELDETMWDMMNHIGNVCDNNA